MPVSLRRTLNLSIVSEVFGCEVNILYISDFLLHGSSSVMLSLWVITSCDSAVPLWLNFWYTLFFLDFSWKLLYDFFENQQLSAILLLCVSSGRHQRSTDTESQKPSNKTNTNSQFLFPIPRFWENPTSMPTALHRSRWDLGWTHHTLQPLCILGKCQLLTFHWCFLLAWFEEGGGASRWLVLSQANVANPANICQCLETFSLSQLGICFWYLVNRDQGFCWTS